MEVTPNSGADLFPKSSLRRSDGSTNHWSASLNCQWQRPIVNVLLITSSDGTPVVVWVVSWESVHEWQGTFTTVRKINQKRKDSMLDYSCLNKHSYIYPDRYSIHCGCTRVCLERGVPYQIWLDFNRYRRDRTSPDMSLLIDSVSAFKVLIYLENTDMLAFLFGM